MEFRKSAKQPGEQDGDDPERARFRPIARPPLRGKGSEGTREETDTLLHALIDIDVTENELSHNDFNAHNNINRSSRTAHTTDKGIPEPMSSKASPTGARLIHQADPDGGSHTSRNPQVGATLTKRKGFKRLFSSSLGSVANALGPIKQAAETFVECIDTYQVAGKARAEYDELVARLETLLDDLARHLGEGYERSMTASMNRLCKSIQEELEAIRDKSGESKLKGSRYIAADEDINAILTCYRRVEGYLERLSLNANLSIWKIAQHHATGYQSDRMFSLIDRLPSVLAARFNSAEGEALKRRECTPGTRIQEIAQVLGWARNRGEGEVYWLNGMAGTGKTTIAYSVCTGLESAHMLGASFFCSRLREECRNVNRIIPSIAYQLARFSRPFHHALCNAIEKEPDAHGRALQMQFDALIKDPTLQVQHALPDELIVVIDALDECENKESTRRMLQVLLNESTNLPIKFILSSRPEPEIRDQMTERVKSRLVLHELDKGQVQGDIERYLREGLAQISPSDAQIAALVERAGILFIYAATAVRYIGYDNFHRNPTSRLRTILSGSKDRINTHITETDQLYTTIIGAALEDEGLEEDDRVDIRQVLHTVICVREPVTVGTLSELLQIHDVDRVRAALRPLWSVLHVVGEVELVTTLHASFADFMFDAARSNAYHCDANRHNYELAKHCFNRIQRNQPQFNVCGLESSYLPDNMVPNIEDRIANEIPLDLFYACRYWADHVEAAKCTLALVSELEDFLSKRLLLWMEIMNLKKETRAGMECMRLINRWCNGLEREKELVELAHDAQRFVDAFARNSISQSTPHIYMSMLAFWPRSRPIAKHYGELVDGPVDAEGPALGQRQLAHLVTWTFKESIRAIAVSSDGLFVALAFPRQVTVLEVSSGRVVLGPLHVTSYVQLLAFSTDGARIISTLATTNRSVDLVGWDVQTGATVLGPLSLEHGEDIVSHVLSPDSTRLATAGHKIRLWDTETGDVLLCLATQDNFRSIVFSTDGTRMAGGSGRSLYIWDTRTGDDILSPLVLGWIDMIAFSPDNSRIVHATKGRRNSRIHVRDARNGDLIHELGYRPEGLATYTYLGYSLNGMYIFGIYGTTVTVWDAQSGKVVDRLEGHKDRITSITFSADGSHMITGCLGGTVCTWDARQHGLVPTPTAMPSMSITCVKFSPSGMQFASGAVDGTICIWDSSTGEMIAGPIKAHTDRIAALDFGDDCVASGSSSNGTMCVCNALSGDIVLGPLVIVQGHTTIDAIIYSAVRKQIVTGSRNNQGSAYPEVNLWNAQTGDRILGPFTGHLSKVFLLYFAPDGVCLVGVLGQDVRTVVWDISTGENTIKSYGSHSAPVNSLCYSPGRALIALASKQETIVLGGAYTGTRAFSPYGTGSRYGVSVSFSPDGTRIVSRFNDGTIWVWDAQTIRGMFQLLHGSTINTNTFSLDKASSVAYSPDGTRILACSDEGSVCVHDARTPEECALSRSTAEYADWTLTTDGWVVDDRSRLLVWVPADLRRALMWPRVQVMIAPGGYVRLRFDKSRMGESWEKSYMSCL